MVQYESGTQLTEIIVHVESWMSELMNPFLTHRREDIALLLIHSKTSDFEAAWNMGHDLKGTGAVYGFKGMATIGQSIEQAAQKRESKLLARLAEELCNYLDRVKLVYR
jgi:HPt (histidine-containing phosphotransfer) domain-containing protein